MAEQAVKERLVRIKGVNQTIQKRLRNQISLGVQKGETTEQITDRIRRVFRSERFRARTIARTEVNAAANSARDIQVRKTFGQDFEKEWITARDGFVRDSHQIDGERVKANEQFSNGLTRPHDPSGRAEEVINCRCLTVFHPKEELEIGKSLSAEGERLLNGTGEEPIFHGELQVGKDGSLVRAVEIQTLIFPKKHWTLDEAKSWAKSHDFRVDKVDTTSVSFRFRQQDPGRFQRLRTWCLTPGDASPSETRCRVKAVGGPRK